MPHEPDRRRPDSRWSRQRFNHGRPDLARPASLSRDVFARSTERLPSPGQAKGPSIRSFNTTPPQPSTVQQDYSPRWAGWPPRDNSPGQTRPDALLSAAASGRALAAATATANRRRVRSRQDGAKQLGNLAMGATRVVRHTRRPHTPSQVAASQQLFGMKTPLRRSSQRPATSDGVTSWSPEAKTALLLRRKGQQCLP